MCRSNEQGGRRCPGTSTGGRTVNYAAPGATVGMQVDGAVSVGDMVINMSGGNRPRPGAGSPADPPQGPGSTEAVQQGRVNVASGNDRVGMQVGGVTIGEDGMSDAFRAMVEQNPALADDAWRRTHQARDVDGYHGALDEHGNRVSADPVLDALSKASDRQAAMRDEAPIDDAVIGADRGFADEER